MEEIPGKTPEVETNTNNGCSTEIKLENLISHDDDELKILLVETVDDPMSEAGREIPKEKKKINIEDYTEKISRFC